MKWNSQKLIQKNSEQQETRKEIIIGKNGKYLERW